MEYPPWHIIPTVKVNCRDCTAECCKHIAVPIDAPKKGTDFQRLAEYVQYEGVTVYRDNDREWYVEFKTRCGQLDGNRCMAFKENKQPITCQEYSVKTCVMNVPGDFFTVLFEKPADVVRFAQKRGISQKIIRHRCTASCGYCEVPIDTPEEWRDYDDIRWYVAHRNVVVRQNEAGSWILRFLTPRREACTSCNGGATKHRTLFSSMEEVDVYLAKNNIAKPKLRLTSY